MKTSDLTLETSVRQRVDQLREEITNRENMPLELWDKEVLDSFTLEALRMTIEHSRNSKLYQNKFAQYNQIESFKDFESLPFSYPEEVKNNLYDILSCQWEEVAHLTVSSGTSGGPPAYIAQTKEDLYGDYIPKGLFHLDKEELVFVALPYGMATPGTALHRLCERHDTAILPASKGEVYSSPERLVEAIHNLKPTVICSTPSYAYFVIELLKEKFPNEDVTLKKLILTGEGLSTSLKKRLEELWNCEVIPIYGSTEMGLTAYSCENGNYHVASGNIYIEIVDDNGEKLPNGKIGNVALSTIGRVANPLIRYRNGDIGMIVDESCSCGYNLPQLRVFGREKDLLPAPEGRIVTFVPMENIILDTIPEVKPWYHIILNDEGVSLTIEKPNLSQEELLSADQKLRDKVEEDTGIKLTGIDWVESGELDRPDKGKVKRVIDKRTV
ncbi:phenylacetate--CoA ligase family protein [Bacillus sp. JAS102]|uniref:phenylacetate--CoA ligase family protein n=1 Tax=Bacillus sp. JAS102 TaxID=2217824 RepID=UPI0011ED0928|nr:AMP-binding protein [Bacillus sp. JAS102]KAA0796740.1 phenylacetate--CoA ligase family protein [Bacillus sp. JAS102]